MEIWYVFRRINTKLDYKVKKFNAEVDSMQNHMPFLWLWWVQIACHELTATIIEKFHGLIDGVENDPVMSYTYINFFLDMICEFNYRYKCQSTDLNKYVFYNQYFFGRGYPIMGRKPVRDERRKQILDAVHQCLLEKPFHKTSIKDIARKAGLNHGALHYYFENKEHILLEYIDYTKKQFDIVYNDFLKEAYVRPTSDLDSINEKCRWTLNELSFHKEYAKIFIEIWAHALYNPNVMKKIKDMYREWRDQFSSDISNIVDSKKEARKISLTMIAVFEGLSLMSSLFAKKDLQYDFDFNGFLKLLNTK